MLLYCQGVTRSAHLLMHRIFTHQFFGCFGGRFSKAPNFSTLFFRRLRRAALRCTDLFFHTNVGGALAPNLCLCYSSRLKPLLPQFVATKVASKVNSVFHGNFSAARESSSPSATNFFIHFLRLLRRAILRIGHYAGSKSVPFN